MATSAGANFEIIVGERPCSYRDDRKVAFEAAENFKQRNPHIEVKVRDLSTNDVTVIQRLRTV